MYIYSLLTSFPAVVSSLFSGDYSKMVANCRNPVIVYLCSFLFFCLVSQAANTIKRGQVIRDGEYVVSASQVFALGFFSPINSTSRYVGIWYHNLSSDAVVWVANRERPISGRNGVLTFGSNGNLMVSDGNENTVWSANVSTVADNSTAILEDSGNLVLSRSEDTAEVYWQSFKNATDTFLPGMKVRNGENQVFYSWKTANDPSLGNYSMGIDYRGSPQVVIWEQSNRHWRSGHWDGRIFSGVTKMNFFYVYGFKYSIEGEYFTYNVSNNSTLLRFWLRWDGMVSQLRWDGNARDWSEILLLPENQCGVYNRCGNFGSCSNMNSLICSCIGGFEPRNKDRWDMGYWSDGCFRRTQLQCERNESTTGKGGRDEFLAIGKVKLPDFADRVDIQDKKLCEAECLKNCSCTAYAHVSGLNCMLWSGDLIDIEQFADGGNTLYVRLADSDLESKGISKVIVTIIALAGAGFLSFFGWLLCKFNKDLKVFFNVSGNYPPAFDVSTTREFPEQISRTASLLGEGKQASGQDLLMFNFSYVAAATSYFSMANKLGQGGFGPVYKGKLPGGEEVAVKRLSKMSGQGMEEFKNEIILISKLQHRNLVRLLGCCIKGEEKMLIYEYMPNKSLDSFLFEPTKRAQLDWGKRVAIIEGIARGLLYLHRDSRLRIIHRDLKASNILLDQEMNPKISDFGMARIFGWNQNEANTNRVVGTFGYMSPEYAMEGLFSVKSDVYSFGVLLLEILSGQRNVSFRWQGHSGLIGYAWQLWKEGRGMEFIDASLSGSCPENEVMRCMHVGMLCVQDSASSRPTISSLLLMLDSNSASNLPIPKQPTFTSMRSSVDVDSWEECRDDIASSNDVTFTAILGR